MQKTISKLKKELDKWFSLYIRIRGSENGLVQCFTCGVVKHYKSGMQCGHFQSRRFMATRYDERNQIQCIKCNMFEQGEQYKFALALDAKYGEGTAEDMQIKARQIQKFSRIDYEEKISYYKEAVEKLKKEKGIE
jgi:hypothetical protein|tara:strand:+ start:115 stop:519 length:405 start_codon:yes stop_codon:yes gene_type:complete